MSAGQVIAGAAAVLLVAIVIWRRRKLGIERTGLAVLVAIALGVYSSGLLPDLPDPKKAIVDIAQALGPWTYALVGALAFLETGAFVGLVAPGETVVIAGGVIAGQGEISLIPLIGLVWACAILGDTTSFFIGRGLGRRFMERYGPRVKITEERLRQVEGYFDRHGGKTILIGRFIGLVRALAPFIAGSSGMPYSRFIPFSIVGTGLWAGTFAVLGYVFWQSFDRVAHVAGQATFAFGVVVAVIVGTVWAYRRLRDEEQRRRLEQWVARQQRKPVLRPLFAVARPLWRGLLVPLYKVVAPEVRFLWERLTPGRLGIELTTTLAVGAVGTYVFVLYATQLASDPSTTPLDRETLDLSDEVRTGALVEVAEVVTHLGAFPTVATVVAATAGLLAARKRLYELVSLVLGAVLLYVGVHLAKAGIDRPRPGGSLVDTTGSSFPSGHAAYSTLWVAVAIAARRVLPGLASRAGLILLAIAVSGVVGLTRVYLHSHYWSDVVGGWALGAGILGLCGAAALIVAYVRQNGERPRAPEGRAAATTER
jgi:membrane protein DedA with SNARE-associated domain/membrane-associated phospholipid phosphatase